MSVNFYYVIRDMVYFLQDWIVSPMLSLLKRIITFPGFEPETHGLAVSIPNHHTIKGGMAIVAMQCWWQGLLQSPIQIVLKGPFEGILGASWIFCMECHRGLLIRRRGFLIPVRPCTPYRSSQKHRSENDRNFTKKVQL
jgi:hypothetical protein